MGLGMSERRPRCDVLVPFWAPGGGVIKLLDHAEHLLASFEQVVCWGPPMPPLADPIHEVPVVARLLREPRVVVRRIDSLDLPTNGWVLFTEPGHHELVDVERAPTSLPKVVHLVQGLVHADPMWNDGRHRRTLRRPMSRVWITPAVRDACRPVANDRCPERMILQGHDVDFFAAVERQSRTSGEPLRVGYTTWKGDIGDEVAAELGDRCVVSALRSPTGWHDLRSFYANLDVFICTPGPLEGFYLPGLEAMAAGAAVVSPVVGGNDTYLDDDRNGVVVPFDDVGAVVTAIAELDRDRPRLDRLATAARSDAGRFRLEREREQQKAFIDDIETGTDAQLR